MLSEIIKFEWAYRRGRPATYIYFALLLLIGFLARATDIIQVSTGGQLKENASLSTAFSMMVLMLAVGTFIISAVMGVAVVRDAENNTESLFFTTPIKKSDYLFGRFIGSFLILVLILTGLPLGFWLGDLMPWRDAARMLPIRPLIYWQPFLTLVIPHAFIMAVIFFSVGALSRRMVVIFTQGLFFIMLYFAGQALLGQLDNRDMAARLDIFGMRAITELTRYWPVAEQNTRLVPTEGIFLQNRLIWLTIALVLLAVTYRLFAFRVIPSGPGKLAFLTRKKTVAATVVPMPTNLALPQPKQYFSWGARLAAFRRMVPFYARIVTRDLPFIALTICGYVLLIFTLYQRTQLDTPQLPMTHEIVGIITGNIFFIIVLLTGIMYAGELVWRERAVRLAQIQDAMPLPTGLTYLSQFVALVLVLAGLFVGAIVLGMLAQLVQSYTNLEPGLYLQELGTTMISLIITIGLAFALQLLINNKFAGYAAMILILFGWDQLRKVGLEHPLTQFDSGSTGGYSDLNGFLNPVGGYAALKTYWLAFVGLLLVAGLLLSVRGTEESLKIRWMQVRNRLTRPFAVALGAMAVLLLSSGAFVYYNTSILNKFEGEKAQTAEQVAYEKTLKRYAKEPQPKITDVSLNVDLYPAQRGFSATGVYTLQNRTKEPVRTVYLQMYPTDDLHLTSLTFSKPGKLDSTYAKRFKFRAYTLAQPLMPGDSLRMNFTENRTTTGFTADGANSSLVPNGTFIDQGMFPSLGYESNYELADDDKRKENKLSERERMRPRTDPIGLSHSAFGNDADEVNFAITVSTDPDQTAIAPGYLQRTWEKPDANGLTRKYFTYKMDRPIANFYAIVSARYAVKKEVYKPVVGNPVSLEIYYHPAHATNLDRMMHGLKASLDYYSANFGAYQHRQMRILEFPRYRGFAQSFANTVPFAERMGFTQQISDKPGKIDYAFYVTCHETAHQWWGHQIESADVQGGTLLIESLSQYSALMVMKKTYPQEMMQKFLKNELDDYLSGRGGERKKEKPLAEVENQQYIHYNKGSLAMFALQDYIGEANVNRALHLFRDKWNLDMLPSTGRYPTSADLITEFRAVTPDSLQSVITDLFETMTLFENKADKVTAKPVGKAGPRGAGPRKAFDVSVTVSSAKFRADSLGNETPTKLNDLIYIGVYGKGKTDQDKLLFYQKYRLTKPKQTFTVRVNEKPTRAGIDPLNVLVDRNSSDNVKAVE
jgi:ABC-2 type transport system permease protein